MLKSSVAALAAAALSVSVAFAGGPVIVEEGQPEVVQERSSSAGWLPILLGVVVLCAVVCDGNNDTVQTGMGG